MMNNRYFTNCKTEEELKKEYKRLAKELHPDCSGKDTTKEFQAMREQFEKVFENLKGVHVNKDGETYRKETSATAEEYMEIIDYLLKFDDVKVEICGTWLWVTGNTYPHRKELKKYRFKYSSNKTAWYLHEGFYFKKRNKALTMDEIRNFYGSKELGKKENKEYERIA